MSELKILSEDYQLLCMLSNEIPDACRFFNDEEMEQINGKFTYEFTIPSDHPDAEFVVEGNLVTFYDSDGELKAFAIIEVEDEHEDGIFKTLTCEHIIHNELLDDYTGDLRPNNKTAREALELVLAGTRVKVGNVDDLGLHNTTFYEIHILEALTKIKDVWGGEYKFRVEVENGSLVMYVDLLFRRGSDTGKQFEYHRNMVNIKRTVNISELKTALYGRGKGEEVGDGYGRRINFEDVTWSIANGDPADKPFGQDWIGDPVALEQFGRKNPDGSKRHKFGRFEDTEQTDPVLLLADTWVQLQEINKPIVTYEMDIIELYELLGSEYDHDKNTLGDTCLTMDYDFNPPILVEERVIELRRSLSDKGKGQAVLGNFLPLFTDNIKRIDDIEKTIGDNRGIWENNTVTDIDIVIEAPSVPTNVTANGLFENISVRWDFDPSIKVAGYEVYASQIQGFAVDASNLVWKGKAGGFIAKAEPNQTWYFRVLTFNPNGDKSGLTAEVSASTAKITGEYIADVTIGNANIKDVSADKMTFGTLDGQNVDVVNLNADNIVGGKLKAQFVQIGEQTTYEDGYNPADKLHTVFQTTPPADRKVIWVDTTDSNNVLWKVWSDSLNDWVLGPSGPRGPEGLQGVQGPQGDQGIQGTPGEDGTSSYTHIAYSTSANGSTGFSVSDSIDKTYIGMYVDTNPTDSITPSDYNWTLIKGSDGAQGIQGVKGDDGQTPYLHIAYSTSADGSTGFHVSDPTGATYIGTYTDFSALDSTDYTKYTWAKFQGPQGPQGPQGLQGLQGIQGDQGIEGTPGADGTSSYTHIAYATNANGSTGFSVSDSVGKTYIGMYVDSNPTDSLTPADYKWTLIKGADGSQGIQGPPGADGQTSYLHIAYATNSTGTTGFDTVVATGKTYIGTYTDYVAADSADPSKYTWALIQGPKGDQGSQGIQGPPGSDGTSLYTWVKYADTSTGGGMNDLPTGKKYIGLAYNKTSATESAVATDYTWSLIQGDQGIQGPAGANGVTTYTWVKYADDVYGGNMSDSPTGKRYIGLAFNKTTATETTNAGDYQWSPLYDNVKVGGRNYLMNSTFENNGEHIIFNGGTTDFVDNAFRGQRGVRRTVTGTTNVWQGIMTDSTNQMAVSDGDVITLSVWTNVEVAAGTGGIALEVEYFPESGARITTANKGIPNTVGVWTFTSATFTVPSGAGIAYARFRTYCVQSGTVVYCMPKIEKGNVPTDWSPAPEDIDSRISDKADLSDLNSLGQIVTDLGTDIGTKADQKGLDDLIADYNARIAQDIVDKQGLSDSLATLAGRTTIVETIANNSKIVTDFVNTVISESEEGIYISNKASSTGILISSSRISFMSNNVEVAYISNQTMQINNGIFVQSATIANFKFEALPGTTILAVQWVGG